MSLCLYEHLDMQNTHTRSHAIIYIYICILNGEEAKRKVEEEARRRVLADPPHIHTLHKHMYAYTHAHKTQEEAARAEVGLEPSASDAELAQLKAYFATGCGSEMRTWLLHKGIDQTDVGSIVLRFLKPEYGVKTLLELFALADADIDEVLQGLPLAKRKVLKALIKQDR